MEETQKLREQAEKSREEAEKAKTEAEWAMNEAEQRGYEVGIVETEEALRVEVPAVCRIYCAKTWDEALNRAGVEASSKLRRPENVFYPEAIRPSDTPTPQAEAIPSTINPNEEVLPPSFPPLASQTQLKRILPLQKLPRTKLQLLLKQGWPSQVFNRIWPPQSC